MSFLTTPKQSEDERQKSVGKIADGLVTGFGAVVFVIGFRVLGLGLNISYWRLIIGSMLVCVGMTIVYRALEYRNK